MVVDTSFATFALLLMIGCGQNDSGGPSNGIISDPDGAARSAVPDAGAKVAEPIDSQAVESDGASIDPGAAAAPVVPCTDAPSILITSRAPYYCGSCGGDVVYPLVCAGGSLACAKSYPGTGDMTIKVPEAAYVVDRNDSQAMTGQCAYLAPYTYPSFGLIDPAELTTARAPELPLKIRSGLSVYGGQGFASIFTDRATGEQTIRSLVVLTELPAGMPIPYSIGQPVRDPITAAETIDLSPLTLLAASHWYRVTVYPAEVQTLVKCHTLGRGITGWLTAPQNTDFYTYSRPMVSQMFIADKGGKGYIQFSFTEALLAADLAANPMAVVAIDGIAQSGCPMPYTCSGTANGSPSDIRLDMAAVPQSFTQISLRIPHAIKSDGGGSIRDGSTGNSNVTIDSDWAVYTFKASDMVLTDNNLVRRWYYVGP